jgi:hypothetical protein
VKKTAVHSPRVFGAKPGTITGTAKLVTATAGHRASYEWEYSPDGGKTWVTAPATLQAKTTVPGLLARATGGRWPARRRTRTDLGYTDPVPRDITSAADARYHELLRAQRPEARLEQAAALTRAVRQLAEAGIRQRHPGASDLEVRVRLTARLYGRQAAERLFGDVPADAV